VAAALAATIAAGAARIVAPEYTISAVAHL